MNMYIRPVDKLPFKLCVTCLLLLLHTFAEAKPEPVGLSWQEKLVRLGVEKLEAQIRQNILNDQQGKSDQNHYVVSLNGEPLEKGEFLEERGQAQYRMLNQSELAALDEDIRLFHADPQVKQQKTGFYVVLVNDWKIFLQEAIPNNFRITGLQDLSILMDNQRQAQLQTIYQQVSDIPNQILQQLNAKGYTGEQYVYLYAKLNTFSHPEDQVATPRTFYHAGLAPRLTEKAAYIQQHLKTLKTLFTEFPGPLHAGCLAENVKIFTQAYRNYDQSIINGTACAGCPNAATAQAFDLFKDQLNKLWLLVADPQYEGANKWVKVGSPQGDVPESSQWFNSVDGTQQALDLKMLQAALFLQKLQHELYWQSTLFGQPSADQFDIIVNRLWRRSQWDIVYALQEEWVQEQVGPYWWVPVYGTSKAAYYEFKVGHQEMGAFQSVLAATDVFAVKSIIQNVSLRAMMATGQQLLQTTLRRELLTGLRLEVVNQIRNQTIQQLLGRYTIRYLANRITTYALLLTTALGEPVAAQGMQCIAKEGLQTTVLVVERTALEQSGRYLTTATSLLQRNATLIRTVPNIALHQVDNLASLAGANLDNLVGTAATGTSSQSGSFSVHFIESLNYFIVSILIRNALNQQSQHLLMFDGQGRPVTPPGDYPDNANSCAVCRSRPAAVYQQFELVCQKATNKAKAKQGLEAICSAISQEQTLREIAAKLLSLPQAKLDAFLNEIAETTTDTDALSQNVSQLTGEVVDTWDEVEHIINSRKNFLFLKNLKKAKNSHLPVHLIGEVVTRDGNDVAVGCHLLSAVDGVRVVLVHPHLNQYYPNGDIFKSKIKIVNATGAYIEKKALSSFFPRSWGIDRVLEEVAYVTNSLSNQVGNSGRLYRGLASDGITMIEVRLTGPTNNLIFDTTFPL